MPWVVRYRHVPLSVLARFDEKRRRQVPFATVVTDLGSAHRPASWRTRRAGAAVRAAGAPRLLDGGGGAQAATLCWLDRRCEQRLFTPLAVNRQLAGELPIHSQRCEETLLTAAVEPAESRCLRSAAAVQKAGRTGSPYCRTCAPRAPASRPVRGAEVGHNRGERHLASPLLVESREDGEGDVPVPHHPRH